MTEIQLEIFKMNQQIFLSGKYERDIPLDTWPNIHPERMYTWMTEEMKEYQILRLWDEEENDKYYSFYYKEN